jgi:hypothetical protein
MNLTQTLMTAAVTGMLAGACGGQSSPAPAAPAGGEAAPAPVASSDAAPAPTADDRTPVPNSSSQPSKHACKGLNDCKGRGGCKTEVNTCKGQNQCKGRGGCKTA